jgi:hypothetical protein
VAARDAVTTGRRDATATNTIASVDPSKLTPEQVEAILRSGSRKPGPKPAGSSYWKRRQLIFSAVILIAGLLYALMRTANAPARVTILNSSGADARSVIVIAGTERFELGELLNGGVQQVQVTPGEPLEIRYDFGNPKDWRDPRPLTAFETVTITLAPDSQVQVDRESPWKRK